MRIPSLMRRPIELPKNKAWLVRTMDGSLINLAVNLTRTVYATDRA